MMEKSALAGEGGAGARPPSFTLFTITYKVAEDAPTERADTVHYPNSSLPLYVLCGLEFSKDDKCGQKRQTFLKNYL